MTKKPVRVSDDEAVELVKKGGQYLSKGEARRLLAGLAAAFLILVLAFVGGAAAQDQTDRRALRPLFRSSCEFWGTCWRHRYDHWRQRRADLRRQYETWEDYRYRPHTRDPWHWDDRARRMFSRGEYGSALRWAESAGAGYTRNHKCHDRIVEVTTTPYKSERKAMREAWKLWVRAINLERGAIWQDPNNSVQRWSLCVAVDIDDTYLGRVSRTAGKVYNAYEGAKNLVTGKEPSEDDADGRNMSCRLWARACPDLPVRAVTETERKEQDRDYREDKRDQRRRR